MQNHRKGKKNQIPALLCLQHSGRPAELAWWVQSQNGVFFFLFIFFYFFFLSDLELWKDQRQIWRNIRRLTSTTETKFTSLSYRTCILFLTFYLYFYILLLLFLVIILLFYFSSFHVVCFVCFISLFDCFLLFTLSYCILISLPSLHLQYYNTLLLAFYVLLFLFRSYISLYYCGSYSHTAPFLGVGPFYYLPELYYCCG